ncbi:MAG TPA: hypothetical protein VF725_11340 [Ktedonobacterales bacterium]
MEYVLWVWGLMNAMDTMDTMDGASATQRAFEHALKVARDRGWNVLPADVTIALVPAYDPRQARQVNYWDVSIRIRVALNRHRSLSHDGHLSGIIRIGGGGLLDTLKESDEAARARLAAGGL